MSLSSFKRKLQNNALFKNVYYALKEANDRRVYDNKFKFKGIVRNRSKNCERLCIVLAGYKNYLYKDVFERLIKYAPSDMDICVITSGLFSEEIDALCETNDWTYLSTKENNVCLVQNIAIKMHSKAKYIYKLDEDIFITEGYFDRLLEAYKEANRSDYKVGVIAPILPVNGYGHLRVLQKLDLVDVYTNRFEKPLYATGSDRKIENDPDAAKFFWGADGYVPTIDELNERFHLDKPSLFPCPIRFSIGAIMFEKELIEDMGYFTVERDISGMAQDEIELCSYCMLKSRPIMITDNIVVGHFSFGPQTNKMKEYYMKNPDRF